MTCLTLLVVLVPQQGGAADDISRARRDMDGITKRLNDLDAWFGSATRQQRGLQKDVQTTDQAIAATNKAIRQSKRNWRALAPNSIASNRK